MACLYWKVMLKDNIAINNHDAYHLYYDQHRIVLKKVVRSTITKTSGYLFWRKQVDVVNESLETICMVPISNVLYVEQVNNEG